MDSCFQRWLTAHRHVITTTLAVQHGLGAQDLRRRVTTGDLVRVTRGGYADGDQFRAASPEQRHLLKARAVLMTSPVNVALSHHSAAMAWSLPWIGTVPTHVHAVRSGPGQQRHSSQSTLHVGLPEAQIGQVDGDAVVEPAYAVLGVAALHGLEASVVAFDAALHTEIPDRDRIAGMLQESRGRPGQREKSREDRLRALGFEVVRLVWADLTKPEKVRALIDAACERSRRAR